MRYIYNTTFHLEEHIEPNWIEWMQKHYIPSVRKQNLCSDLLFTRIRIEEPHVKSYSLQLIFPTEENFLIFKEKYQQDLTQDLLDRFNKQVLYFSTLLEEL